MQGESVQNDIPKSVVAELETAEDQEASFHEVDLSFYDSSLYISNLYTTDETINLIVHKRPPSKFETLAIVVDSLSSETLQVQLLPNQMLEKEGLQAVISNATHRYMFTQESEVCADACTKGIGSVSIFHTETSDRFPKEWRKLNATLPFATPDGKNYVPFFVHNYLYVMRVEKNQATSAVYRSVIQESGKLSDWQQLDDIPTMSNHHAYENILVDGSSIYYPKSRNELYKGMISESGAITVQESIALPAFRNVLLDEHSVLLIDHRYDFDLNQASFILYSYSDGIVSQYPDVTFDSFADSNFISYAVLLKNKLYIAVSIGGNNSDRLFVIDKF